MLSNRSLLLATACALPFSLVACGSSSSSNGTAGPPTGTNYGYVINKATVVPPAGQTYVNLGLDLGSPTSSTLDGKVDNGIGQALGALSGLLAGQFDLQGAVNNALNAGTVILLVNFQTPSFTSSGGSGFKVEFGDIAKTTPPPCANAQDTTCGGHLQGTATIGVATDSPADAEVNGKIVNGQFDSDPGTIPLSLSLGGTAVNVTLTRARVRATNISATNMTAIIGGIITQDELKTSFAPALLGELDKLLTADGCKIDGTGQSPGCGCTTSGTLTSLVFGSIDGDDGTPKDCKITVNELLAYPALQAVLKTDSCAEDSCTAADAYSIGVAVTAVKATINN